jgi:hypothetical protein
MAEPGADTLADYPGERLLDVGNGLEIWKFAINDLREQDLNARVMDNATFTRLQKTIGDGRRLEQLPFVAKTQRGMEIVSGHHRTRAARAAGLTEIHALVDVSGLTPSQIKAKQLAHNAIAGQDDPGMVKRIYEEIDDVELKLEAHIDPKILDLDLDRIGVVKADVDFDFSSTILVFVPYQRDVFLRAIEAVMPLLDGEYVDRLVVDKDAEKDFQAAITRAGKAFDVRATTAKVTKMSEMILDSMVPEDAAPETHVYAGDLFGSLFVDARLASLVQDVVAQYELDNEPADVESAMV